MSGARSESAGMRVAFVHPDLGVGGAERLIVDAAAGLQERGHAVEIYTAYFDPQRCFAEVSPCEGGSGAGGSIPVKVVGGWIPRTVFGRMQALLTSVQCMYIALYLCLLRRRDFDVAICDVVSAPNVVFHLFSKPVVFYCHFPDKLLAESLQASGAGTGEGGPPHGLLPFVKRRYRQLVDRVEESSMRYAQVLIVNSIFTAEMFRSAFPSLQVQPRVIYPSVPVDEGGGGKDLRSSSLPGCLSLVSLNRFERKKSIDLAIRLLSELRTRLPPELFSRVRLTVAGGYDSRLEESVTYERELRELADELSVAEQVTFRRNVSDAERRSLLSSCTCVIYTPANEHFGIVPVEAMAAGSSVVACRSGGPLETVVHGVTGFLCAPNPAEFAEHVATLVRNPGLAAQLGAAGRRRAVAHFSRRAFAAQLEAALEEAVSRVPAASPRAGKDA